MSTLVAVAYPDVSTAQTVLGKLGDMQTRQLITLEDAVVVEHRDNGKVKLHQTISTTGTGAVGGALWGGLIGLLFLAPLLGMAVGAGAGAAAGAATDVGVDDNFMKDLGNNLPAGSAALVLLVNQVTIDKVLAELGGQYGGRILQTSLSQEEEQHLREAAASAAANA
ncbi:DUF1269 domain-containing protein [Stackebrandtia nassauensis]|uniref:Membrane protein of uknown function UCP014873 n=1 Tax=Stackebrandtia nassauensis (strain DSM 44728 / CIP 108903 / NRRL B-16338 / NBRC 102104 / LLR-40K-21) TaxID=446470 RepID=D3Q234_STANL|nr:DUF1269 domain-containing protein [Stackebrandtia nassauensis]ADD41901.1 membrane protein of unknown function UCP014873 [Stackebrandtia nassauensis DSM 44728]